MFSPRYRQRLQRGILALSAGVVALFCGLDSAGRLDWLENRTADWRAYTLAKASRGDPGIVIIDIDNASYRSINDGVGRWPWTRRVWTDVLRFVSRGKPKAVLFDIIFDGEEPGADTGFAQAIADAGNVVLPFAFTSNGIADNGPPMKARIPKGEGPERRTDEWSITKPTAALDSAMAASGSALNNRDPDGITRRVPLAIHYGGQTWATFWLAAAQQASPGAKLTWPPLDAQGNYIIRWNGGPLQAYTRMPLFDIICSIHPGCDDPDHLMKVHKPEDFAGKIVIVGASAAGSFEVRPTAMSETAPGMFVVATAIDNILHGDGIRKTPAWLTWVLAVFLVALPASPILRSRSLLLPLGIALGVIAAYVGVCFLAYQYAWWLPMATPVLAVAVSFTANTSFRYLRVDRELARTRNTLEAYVAPQLVRHVMDHLDDFRFDGEKRKLTILFSDVRSFTTLTEKSDPVRLLQQLNRYLEAMTDIIFKYEGIVDKFIGDGIMAHWGAFTPDHPNALLASKAALEMMEVLAQLNDRFEADGFPRIDIGIGVNTGEVIFGNVGAGKKLDFTAIGDGVNLAARLEGANKEYKTHIIISEATRNELGSAARVNSLGSIVVKGKTVGVEIFELTGLE